MLQHDVLWWCGSDGFFVFFFLMVFLFEIFVFSHTALIFIFLFSSSTDAKSLLRTWKSYVHTKPSTTSC